MKEWRSEQPWTREHEPTITELREFILESLQSRLGLNSSGYSFLNLNFSRLLSSGRLFLILDSFDEIPQLLDAQDANGLIQVLSRVATQLITESCEGRGIIASRLFRKPEIISENYSRLEIRPLSDAKISRLIEQQAAIEEHAKLIKEAVFARRPDLAAPGRNPLLLTLLIEYVNVHGVVPENQYDMFRSHMDRNVSAALNYSDYRDLDRQKIWEATERIAQAMFDHASFGLELPVDLLRRSSPRYSGG